MEKLELKHLAPYLPYDLGIATLHSHNENRFYQTMKVVSDYGYSNSLNDLILGKSKWGYKIKPILRPLSDLTKEKLNTLSELCGGVDSSLDVQTCFGNNQCCNSYDLYDNYKAICKLFEWHFDVFGLIEKGLAIDINTL